jgi:F0F1-type ATP synthase delta subunit
VSSICFTSILNGKFELKYLIYSPIVGGIAVGSSSAIIDNTLSALLLGIGASMIHLLLFKI